MLCQLHSLNFDDQLRVLFLPGYNMSTIYGERENTFLRLQEAIILKRKDESIFAWGMGIAEDKREYSGLLAPSPSSFVDCGDVVGAQGSTGFDVENGELRISLKTFPYCMETYYALLTCAQQDHPDARIFILISSLSTENEYVRVNKTYVGGKVLLTPSSLGVFKTRDIWSLLIRSNIL
jgi:hypothetical protein